METKLKVLIDCLDKRFDSILISSYKNIFYFTGLQVSSGYLLVTREISYLFVDFRYIELARRKNLDCEVILIDNVLLQIDYICKRHNIINICIESYDLSINAFNNIKSKLSVEFICDDSLSNLISSIRQIKTEEEISFIKKAQHFTDEAFSYILENIKVGMTEREISLNLEFFTRKLGSEGPSFDFIVASGPNSSLPHAVPSDRKIKKGDFVLLDFGCIYNGYKSDMSRTIAIGEISEKQREVYDIVLNAQDSAIKATKKGVLCCDIDKIARDIIYNSGYKGCFGHSLGHSLGLDIHEHPSFSTNCKVKLQKNMLMTVEPGIYIEGEFGVRIEDIIIVKNDGCENITSSQKNLIIV